MTALPCSRMHNHSFLISPQPSNFAAETLPLPTLVQYSLLAMDHSSDREGALDDKVIPTKGNQLVEERTTPKAKTTDQEPHQVVRNEHGQKDSQQQQQKQSNNRQATSSTVFVTGMSPALTKLHIEKLFGKCGTVHRVDIKTANSGASYCFCDMDSTESAQKAIDNLNGRMLLHKRLVVQPATTRERPMQKSGPSPHTNPARERRLLDLKIQELKQKIHKSNNS